MFAPMLACVTNKLSLSVNKRDAQFGVQALASPWQQKSFRGADLYFEHGAQQATIFLSSQCEKISDSPLEALTAQLLVGFSEIAIKKQERLKLAEREALISSIEAKIDGVPRFLKIMVLRKNRCVFDGVFSSELSQAHLAKDFDSLISGFWAEAKL